MADQGIYGLDDIHQELARIRHQFQQHHERLEEAVKNLEADVRQERRRQARTVSLDDAVPEPSANVDVAADAISRLDEMDTFWLLVDPRTKSFRDAVQRMQNLRRDHTTR